MFITYFTLLVPHFHLICLCFFIQVFFFLLIQNFYCGFPSINDYIFFPRSCSQALCFNHFSLKDVQIPLYFSLTKNKIDLPNIPISSLLFCLLPFPFSFLYLQLFYIFPCLHSHSIFCCFGDSLILPEISLTIAPFHLKKIF